MRQRYEVPGPGEPFDPAIYRLGSPCKRNHLWDEGGTLRTVKGRKCPVCQRIDASERQHQYRAADREKCNAKAAAYKRRARADGRMRSRSKHGLPYRFLQANGFSNSDAQVVVGLLNEGLTVQQIQERLLINRFIRAAGKAPSVARLVYEQQRTYWRDHPEDQLEYARQRNKSNSQWRYMTDESYRLYHRSKSKRRKAQERGSRTVILSPEQLWRRWLEFDHCCAYCGATGDLQVEHVVPISKGGEHHLGNIVPACQRCNFSKGKADAEAWYRAQSHFSETRWTLIVTALAKGQPEYHQPDLLAA